MCNDRQSGCSLSSFLSGGGRVSPRDVASMFAPSNTPRNQVITPLLRTQTPRGARPRLVMRNRLPLVRSGRTVSPGPSDGVIASVAKITDLQPVENFLSSRRCEASAALNGDHGVEQRMGLGITGPQRGANRRAEKNERACANRLAPCGGKFAPVRNRMSCSSRNRNHAAEIADVRFARPPIRKVGNSFVTDCSRLASAANHFIGLSSTIGDRLSMRRLRPHIQRSSNRNSEIFACQSLLLHESARLQECGTRLPNNARAFLEQLGHNSERFGSHRTGASHDQGGSSSR